MNKNELLHFVGQYKLLEKDFTAAAEYVTVTPKNYPTFSPRFIQLFLNICSEIDSFLGVTTEITNTGIINKMNEFSLEHTNLRNGKVTTCELYGSLSLVPFVKFDSNNTTWWTSYNKIKHDRCGKDGEVYNYEKANLKSCLDALAGFYILLRIYADKLDYKFNSTIFENELVM